jgi:hypothetical protein
MGSRYTNTKLISDGPSKLQKFFKLLLVLATLCVSGAALYTIVSFFRAEETIVSDELLPYGALDKLTSPEVFMRAYMLANCNDSLLKSTQTIRVRGHMVHGTDKQSFTLIKKRPDAVLFTIENGPNEITFGVSDGVVWRRIRNPQNDDQLDIVEGLDAEVWLKQRQFFDLIVSASLGDGHITEIGTTSWNSKDALEVTILDNNEKTVKILVAPETMYPISQLETGSDGAIIQTVYSDYQDISGMPIPFQIESSINGEVDSLIVLDSASLNSGVLSRLFEVPEALTSQ